MENKFKCRECEMEFLNNHDCCLRCGGLVIPIEDFEK